MEFIVTLVATQLFTRAVRKELLRSGRRQHPAITGAGLVMLELL